MGLPNRSIRNRIAATTLAVLTLFATLPSSLTAQEALQPQGNAAGLDVTEPVIVLTLGSVNKLMQDINYLTGAMGKPEAGGMFTMMAGTFTQGVNASEPIAVLVPLVNSAPQPIALIPTSDVKTVLKRLEAQTGPADELEDGTLVIAVGANTVFIRQTGNWAVLAGKRELLDLAPADPSALFQEMGNSYDLAVRLKMQQVPAETRRSLTASLRQGFEQAMAQQGGDTEASRKMAEGTIEQLEQVINETDQLKFGINIDPSGQQLVVDASFTAVPGSKLAAIYGGQQAIPSQFSSVIREDAAAYYHAATSVSAEAVEQSRASIATSLNALRKALTTEVNITPAQQAEITEVIDRIADLAIASISEGRADVGALLLADKNDFRFVFGSFVSDGGEAAKIVKNLAAKVEGQPGAPRFTFDSGTYKGVNLHLIEADVPASEDEARRIFGETLHVHLGTGPKSVYLAVGNDSQTLLQELIDAGSNQDAADRPIGQLRFTLMPILQYAQTIESNDTIAAMIDTLSRAPDAGELNVVSTSIDNGQESHVAIGEGLLQAIGAAIQQVQAAKMPAGQF